MIDDLIVVTDSEQTDRILVFDKNGRFIRRIGAVGQGPGEYVGIADSSIDFDKKEVYLFDSSNSRINRYDLLSGKFIKSVSIDRSGFRSYYIQYIHDKIYANATPLLESGDSFLLQEINIETGERMNSYLRASEYNHGWNDLLLRQEGFFYPDDKGKSKYVEMFMDTIVCLDNESIRPYLAVKVKNWITSKDIHDLIECRNINNEELKYQVLFERNISYNIHCYFEIGDMIYFQYRNNGHREFVIYDKNTNTARVTNLFVDDIVYCNGKMMFPLFTFSDSKGVYSCLETRSIPRFLEIVYSDGLNPSIDKIDELKAISEESNPIIFYYECK